MSNNVKSTLPDLASEFVGRKVFITGGSRGIGAAIAQRLLDGGAEVVVTARSKTDDTPEGATFIKGDISTLDGAKAVTAEAIKILGGLDILINNAGAARVYMPNSEAIPDEEWIDALDLNFLSAVRVTNASIAALKESKFGAIVNVTSGGLMPYPGPMLHYGAAKAALSNYTTAMAKELAPLKIRVNLLTPGLVVTPGADDIRKTITDAMGIPPEALFQGVPLGRPGYPNELAELVSLLVSDRGTYLTGHNWYVDGGWATLSAF
jgi:NAD(P)-dependent dehydrogenase (short-subunit alcohol dehydrogenase family)